MWDTATGRLVLIVINSSPKKSYGKTSKTICTIIMISVKRKANIPKTERSKMISRQWPVNQRTVYTKQQKQSLMIGHVQYINILTWLRGLQDQNLYLVVLSRLGIELQMKLKIFTTLTRKLHSHVRILIYRAWPI